MISPEQTVGICESYLLMHDDDDDDDDDDP
jgi:hypothetical protein